MPFSSRYFMLKVVALGLLVVCIMTLVAVRTPADFPSGTEFHIPQGASLSDIADTLAEERLITSPFLFKVAIVLRYGHKGLVAGDYAFAKPESLLTIVRRLATGNQELVPVKVTLPEGSSVADIAWIFLKKMPHFNAPYFVQIAHPYEGYLFPDTYLFYPNKTEAEVLAVLRRTFDEKIAPLSTDLKQSGHSLRDIVIMASILEKEATGPTDRGIISGILWKRLAEGMPLQVDAPLAYITANTSGKISLDDTKIDSPYNTYKNKGLPKGPITNPGIEALVAALHPVKTPYYYYLSDAKGVTHYAKTFDEHVSNKNKYLR